MDALTSTMVFLAGMLLYPIPVIGVLILIDHV
jgi:hypothetical protein